MRTAPLLHLSLAAALLLAPGTSVAQTEQYRTADGRTFVSQRDTGTVAAAARLYAAEPTLERAIALGAAQSAIRQYREALQTYSDAVRRWPDAAIAYRWRGHRRLTLRDFDGARADLLRATQLDSTLYGGWYHLGVVSFITGDFATAARAFRTAIPLAPDAGERAGSTDWLWQSLSRSGQHDAAAALLRARPDSVPAGNAYETRLKLYRGQIAPDQVFTPADTAGIQRATLAFGLGSWYLARGDSASGNDWFRRAYAADEGWPAFGFIAAEAALARRARPGGRPE